MCSETRPNAKPETVSGKTNTTRQKMTDKQKEYLFKSIENFDLFLNKVNKRITIELLNEGKITFDKNYVIIFINNQTEQLNIEEFLTLTKEIIEQKVVDLKAEIQ